jgi:hypothetical protein
VISRQRTQQRYREADIYRLAKQQQPLKQAQADGYLYLLPGKAIPLVHKARVLAQAIMIQSLRQTWLG